MDEPTLPGFVAWLKRRDPNERYSWPQAEACACGQYAKSLGKKEWLGTKNKTWSRLNMIARGPANTDGYVTADSDAWTFGQCLERAERELEPAE